MTPLTADGDGTLLAPDLDDVAAGDVVAWEGGQAVALELHRHGVRLGLLTADRPPAPPLRVEGPLQVPVGPLLRGRVLDALGRPLDGHPFPTAPHQPLSRAALRPSLRPAAHRSATLTGHWDLDVVAPVPPGAAILYAGPDAPDGLRRAASGLAARSGWVVVWCARRPPPDPTGMFHLCTRHHDPPALQAIAPWAAAAVADDLARSGADVALVVDELDAWIAALARLHHHHRPTVHGLAAPVVAEIAALLNVPGRRGAGCVTLLCQGDLPPALRHLVDRRVTFRSPLAPDRPLPFDPDLPLNSAAAPPGPIARLAARARVALATGAELRGFLHTAAAPPGLLLRPTELDPASRDALDRADRVLRLLALRRPSDCLAEARLGLAWALCGDARDLDAALRDVRARPDTWASADDPAREPRLDELVAALASQEDDRRRIPPIRGPLKAR